MLKMFKCLNSKLQIIYSENKVLFFVFKSFHSSQMHVMNGSKVCQKKKKLMFTQFWTLCNVANPMNEVDVCLILCWIAVERVLSSKEIGGQPSFDQIN